MKSAAMNWQWMIKHLLYLVAATVLFGCILSLVMTGAQSGNDDGPAWTTPTSKTLRQVSALPSIQHEPNFLENLDCSLIDYRRVGSATMENGCFSDTAFGLFDSSSSTVIFNGTDEAVPLHTYTAHQILVPCPGALELLALDGLSTGGSIISLYRNPLSIMQDQWDSEHRLLVKQLTAPPDITLKDASGQRLVINPQSLAFSSDGSWLVAETVYGSFVRINMATLEITAFARSYTTSGSPGVLLSRISLTDDGRFAAIANDFATEFKVYDIDDCDGTSINLQPQRCAVYDYWQFVGQKISNLHSLRHVRFINEDVLSFEARVLNDVPGNGMYLLAPKGSITFLAEYLALGDSYSSGEGAFDYLTGTDTSDNMCHLSRQSYPLLLANDLFGAAGGHSVACSGAVINDIASTSAAYHGQVRGVANWQELQQTQPQLLELILSNFQPGYIAQHRFAQRWQPRMMTVSVGGNDIGFGSIIQSCVVPKVNIRTVEDTCFGTYEDRLELQHLIDRTVPRWVALYRQLLREAPGTTLYSVGYPHIARADGSCAANVQLNQHELEFAASLIDYLNVAIEKASLAAGIQYIDISQALVGFRLCEAASYAVAVNGLTSGKDGGPFGTKIIGKESYHPNALGQQLIEQAILKQLQGRGAIPPSIAGNQESTAALLSGSKTGRPLFNRQPDAHLVPDTANWGSTIMVQASGVEHGLKPQTAYTIHFDGPAQPATAVVTSTVSGDISVPIMLSDSLAPGSHTIDVTGTNQTGNLVDLTKPLYIPASDTDADADGIPNSLDTCPGARNSGDDADQDGTDDICDSLIGGAPAMNNPNLPPPSLAIVSTFQVSGVPLQASPVIKLQTGANNAAIVLGVSIARSATLNPDTKSVARDSMIIPNPGDKTHNTAAWSSPVTVPLSVWCLSMLGLYLYWSVHRRNYLLKN